MTPSLVVGPLRGYRYWYLRRRAGRPALQSHFYPTLWPAEGALQARCADKLGPLAAWARRLLHRPHASHTAPTWKCGCGIYAFADPVAKNSEELTPQGCQHRQLEDSVRVFGVVLLWGRVIQHEYGYRAEYARPVTLLADPGLARGSHVSTLIEAVATRYSLRIVHRVEDLVRPA